MAAVSPEPFAPDGFDDRDTDVLAMFAVLVMLVVVLGLAMRFL